MFNNVYMKSVPLRRKKTNQKNAYTRSIVSDSYLAHNRSCLSKHAMMLLLYFSKVRAYFLDPLSNPDMIKFPLHLNKN